ncbi:MAG: sigma-E factor negative regulatory protein [Pseudomonadota bacterium]
MDINKEQISALMDGELDVHECEFLIRKLNRESAMRQSWHRYHVARACMQQEFDGCTSMVSRVRIALDGVEPDRVSTWPGSVWLRTGVGGALAACVALVAVVGLDTRLAPGEAEIEVAPDFVSQSTSLDRQFSQQAVPVSLNNLPAGRSPISASQIVAQPFEDTQARINRYLIQNDPSASSSRSATFSPILAVPLQPVESAIVDESADSTRQDSNVNQP